MELVPVATFFYSVYSASIGLEHLYGLTSREGAMIYAWAFNCVITAALIAVVLWPQLRPLPPFKDRARECEDVARCFLICEFYSQRWVQRLKKAIALFFVASVIVVSATAQLPVDARFVSAVVTPSVLMLISLATVFPRPLLCADYALFQKKLLEHPARLNINANSMWRRMYPPRLVAYDAMAYVFVDGTVDRDKDHVITLDEWRIGSVASSMSELASAHIDLAPADVEVVREP